MQSESKSQISYFGNMAELPCYNALLSKRQHDTVCGNWARMGGDCAPGNGNNQPAFIDAMGRYLFVNLRVSF